MKKRIKSYRVLEEVAAGGHATVHRVFDSRTNQSLALKVLHPHLSKDPEYLARFQREAKLLSALDHLNVVRIYEVG
ncbi:MAG: serine/threonine protein kinase, partial [Dehalococcoidia bacterium]|nr:serine/threonine protein kinase [Dehalococcoidia bacterium]